LAQSISPRSPKSPKETNTQEHSEEAVLDGQKVAESALSGALSQKALDAVIYDVRGKSSITDYIMIASGTSGRHVKGISDRVNETLSSLGQSCQHTDGYEEGEWVVLDYGDVIIHIFYEPKRQEYRFDELLKSSEKLPLPEELYRQVRSLKTGMHDLK